MSASLNLSPSTPPQSAGLTPVCPLRGAHVSPAAPTGVDQYHKDAVWLFVPFTPSEEFSCLHP